MTDPTSDNTRKMRDFSRSLPMALLRAREAVMERFRPNLRANDVTDQQWRVLRALYDHGAMDLGDLAEICCLLKPSLSRIIRDLETRNLLLRKVDQKDQRRSVVSIKSGGRILIEKVGPHSEKRYNEIAKQFGSQELDDLYSKLENLIETLERLDNEKRA